MRAANDQNLFRRTIEQEVERLLCLLDTIDGDCDLEPNGDENDTGMPEGWVTSRRSNGQTIIVEDDEDGHDAEPEETDQDGDEQDSSLSEDDNLERTATQNFNKMRGSSKTATQQMEADMLRSPSMPSLTA